MTNSYMQTPSMRSDVHTDGQNQFNPEGCVLIRSSMMVFLPWNNSDNIISREVESSARIVQLYIVLILFLIGGPANVINMAVFLKQGLRDRVNLVLFSLSLADGVTLVMTALLRWDEFRIHLTGRVSGGSVYAFIVNNQLVVIQGSGFVSIILSAVLACERCYCVLFPLKYQTMMRTRTTACMIVAVCVVIYGLYFVSILRYHYACAFDVDTGEVMSMLFPSEVYMRHKGPIDFISNVIFGAFVPVGVLLVVVTATAVTVWKLRQSVAWRSETASSISPKEVALTKMLVGTSVLLIFCLSPTVLFRIIRVFLTEVNVGRRHHNLYLLCLYISELITMINSGANIFVYYVMGSRYRHTLWALFKRQAGQKRMHNVKR